MGEFDEIATSDDILKLAAQRTGLTALDSDSWRDGLAIMIDEVNTSPAFTPSGREMILNDATDALGGRMRKWLAHHPQDHYGVNTYRLDESAGAADKVVVSFP
jgi:hypothetical protein